MTAAALAGCGGASGGDPGAKPLPLVPPKFVKAKGKLDALFDAPRQALPSPNNS